MNELISLIKLLLLRPATIAVQMLSFLEQQNNRMCIINEARRYEFSNNELSKM